MADERSDVELVLAIAQRDRDAERSLVQRFAPRIRLYGLRHLRDEDRARDLVQSVMLAVIESAREGRIREGEKVDRYVLGTCRNTALRMREHEKRAVPTDPVDLPEMAFEEIASVDTTALFGCVEQLEQRARHVVRLTFMEERSADDVAELLGLAAGNVRVIRHRAVAALRKCLDEKEASA